MVFGAKWALLLLGPLVALSWGGFIGLTVYRYSTHALGREQAPTVLMALMSILFGTLALLLVAAIGSAVAGACIMAFAEIIRYKSGAVGRKAET